MDFKGEKVLVLGLGISGLSTVGALNKMGAEIVVVDSKEEKDLGDFLEKTKNISMEKHLACKFIDLSDIDLIVKSPGIKPNNPIIIDAKEKNIEIITDIELAYRISPTKNIVTITGTNGKTTTTTLIGSIFKEDKRSTYIVGNIGVGILETIVDAKDEDNYIIEASSFQLENTTTFRPRVGLILNISPDHLDWHGSMDNYIASKSKIYINQTSEDYMILNAEDKNIKELSKEIKAKKIWFSISNKLEKGIYIENQSIVFKDQEKKIEIIKLEDIKLLGKHNLENIMGAIGVCLVMGIDPFIIKKTIENFKAVEHRIEYVDTVKNIKFYNDSKGTNPESTIRAIESMMGDISLIAGGYDKGSSYDELIKAFANKVRSLVLLGETKYKIEEAARRQGFENIILVDTMEEAVYKAFENSHNNDNVLLSPACASWGMYNSFEERGKDFKSIVKKLKEEKIG